LGITQPRCIALRPSGVVRLDYGTPGCSAHRQTGQRGGFSEAAQSDIATYEDTSHLSNSGRTRAEGAGQWQTARKSLRTHPLTIEGELVQSSAHANSAFTIAIAYSTKFGNGDVIAVDGNKLTIAFDGPAKSAWWIHSWSGCKQSAAMPLHLPRHRFTKPKRRLIAPAHAQRRTALPQRLPYNIERPPQRDTFGVSGSGPSPHRTLCRGRAVAPAFWRARLSTADHEPRIRRRARSHHLWCIAAAAAGAPWRAREIPACMGETAFRTLRALVRTTSIRTSTPPAASRVRARRLAYTRSVRLAIFRRNLWALERALIKLRHKRIKMPRARARKCAALPRIPDQTRRQEPLFYAGGEVTEIQTKEFL